MFNKNLDKFKDRELEAEFIKHENAAAIKYIRPAVLVLGILFFLFIIPDYYLTESMRNFGLIFMIRATFLALVILLYLQLKINPNRHLNLRWIPVYAFIASASFLLIYYIYESPNLFIQSFGVVALILVFFHLVNRWLQAFLISIFLGSGFIIVTLTRPEEVINFELLAVSIYIALVIVLSSISAFRINMYKRMQFINTRELQLLSETDSLTGIYVRGKFDQELSKWIELANRYGHPLSIIMFDIDDLKKVNDRLGHLAGDRIISTLASLVRRVLRKTDIFARWGGDEFVILLPNTEKDQAYELAERIRDLIAGHSFKAVGFLSCSFGVEELRKGDERNSLLSRVDRKLYEAKESGKNIVK